jgi:transposase/transcription initiation factor IIE alpha subunit
MSAEQGVLVEGLEERPAAAAAPPAQPVKPKKRVKAIDREQVVLRQINVGRMIDEDHPARAICALLERLDLSQFYEGIKAVEGRKGRDHSDPKVLIALWLYAISRGVREARELDRWAQYEPACQWLLGLGRVNYHTLSDFVTEHEAALDELFVELLEVLMAEDMATLERIGHDGTKIRAAASRSSFKREERLAECRKLAEDHLAALKQQPEAKLSAARRKAQQRGAEERLGRIQRAERELKRRQADKPVAEQKQVRVSITDPEARVMKQGDGGFAPGFNVQVSTDACHGVIVAYDVTQAGEDSQQLQPALDHIEENTGRLPGQTLVDGGYTTRQNILETAERPTELIGSLGEDRSKNKLERHGVSAEFMPERFTFDATTNSFTCPAGKALRYKRSNKLVGATEKQYQAQPSDCKGCAFRSQCCPKTAAKGRLLIQIEEHPKVAEFRQKMQQPEYRSIYRQRAQVAEFSNACIKEKKGLRKFLRRGLGKVRAETAWACLSCNVSIWIRLSWKVSPGART